VQHHVPVLSRISDSIAGYIHIQSDDASGVCIDSHNKLWESMHTSVALSELYVLNPTLEYLIGNQPRSFELL
jgi:hypothetical protein